MGMTLGVIGFLIILIAMPWLIVAFFRKTNKSKADNLLLSGFFLFFLSFAFPGAGTEQGEPGTAIFAIGFLGLIIGIGSLITASFKKKPKRRGLIISTIGFLLFFIGLIIPSPTLDQTAQQEPEAVVGHEQVENKEETDTNSNTVTDKDQNQEAAEEQNKEQDHSESSSDQEKSTNEQEENSSADTSNDTPEQNDSSNTESTQDTSQENTGTDETSDQDDSTSTDSNFPTATVTRVVDGDTIEINLNGKTEDVRLLLVDTPETKHPRLPVQKFGPEASQFAKDTLSGKTVGVEYDGPKRDKYDRLLAYLWVDGKNFNQMLLEKGLARYAYVYNPPYTHSSAFMKAQNRAKSAELGIWSIPGYVSSDGFQQTDQNETEVEGETNSNQSTDTTLPYDPNGPDRDCGDFDSQEQAQKFYEAAGGPDQDPHRLDGEGDGLVCESL
ncbi:hypothetical protein GCM10011351_29290 [Paraliobacillus quinghaiensis]|uniref:TNase-like domain-containing protein n=1 Tax=Paraliobacillus quinghaiensis TaxID=470815 RepID=A0A917TXL3_9BACI|nr:thermonuclease family protein [Paraliobacillus quinghaiensis]GGM41243.1 hypothetical protein GCM10011351_29290 [Paraliobacillus quinghaiensis]